MGCYDASVAHWKVGESFLVVLEPLLGHAVCIHETDMSL